MPTLSLQISWTLKHQWCPKKNDKIPKLLLLSGVQSPLAISDRILFHIAAFSLEPLPPIRRVMPQMPIRVLTSTLARGLSERGPPSTLLAGET